MGTLQYGEAPLLPMYGAFWKMLLVAEQRFRRLDAPERMKQVFLDVQFQNGVEVKREEVLVVA